MNSSLEVLRRYALLHSISKGTIALTIVETGYRGYCIYMPEIGPGYRNEAQRSGAWADCISYQAICTDV